MKTRLTKTKSLPTLFQPAKAEIVQTVNVNVSIEQQDDGIEECVTSCFRCCAGIAKAAAK